MLVLGIDPGTSHTGWACLDGTALHRHGAIHVAQSPGNLKEPWERRRKEILRVLRDSVVKECQPELVAIESTQVNHGLLRDDKDGGKPQWGRIRSQVANTVHLQDLVSAIVGLCEGMDIAYVTVSPNSSLAALSCKRGATDGEQSAAFSRLFGVKLLASEHHIARAAGVALRGPHLYRVACALEVTK